MKTYVNGNDEEYNLDSQVSHPEGRIALLDGSIIVGFPLQMHIQVGDNTMSLDTTGEFLQIRGTKVSPRMEDEMVKAERKRLEEIFYKNAFFFLSQRKKILSDSRMFLTPLPVKSGLAYTGTSGFRNPILGVYIEWWTYSYASRKVSDDGTTELLWYIAGSPLSGSNSCSAVNDKGVSHGVSVPYFMKTWQSFVEINTRYDECKGLYEAYSLEETLALLRRDQIDE